MTAETTPELDDLREAHAAIKPGNWVLDDCEDDLQIWRESALERVTRDETGEINGYSTPSSFQAVDRIAWWDVETWNEGESFTDDEYRRVARFMVAAYNRMPALLDEVEGRLPLGDVDHFLRRERDEYEPRGECWNTVSDVLDSFRLHVITGTPLTAPRPEGGPEALGVGPKPLTEIEELRALLIEARRDAHTARIDYNLARTRADKAEAQLSAVWALVEPWRSTLITSTAMQRLVYGLLSIRDRADLTAESSSPSGEQG